MVFVLFQGGLRHIKEEGGRRNQTQRQALRYHHIRLSKVIGDMGISSGVYIIHLWGMLSKDISGAL